MADMRRHFLLVVSPEFVTAEARRVERKAPENFDAWDYAVRGNWHFWRMDQENMAKSRHLFEAALERDPKNLVALSGLALACSAQMIWHWTEDREGTRTRAAEAARRAVDIDENDAWAQVALSFVSAHTGRQDVSLRACRRAVELNPNLALAEGFLTQRLAWMGEYEEANLHADRAERLSPRDPAKYWWNFPRVIAAFMAGKNDEYRSWSEAVTESAPSFPGGWIHLAASNALFDRQDEAQMALEQYLRLLPNGSISQVAAFIPACRPEDRERLLDLLRKAGMPE